MKFSQRIGKTPLTKEIQLESMDVELKVRLWNVFHIFICPNVFPNDDVFANKISREFTIMLWDNHLKEPTDSIPNASSFAIAAIRNYFFNCEWYKIYNFIEFIMDLIKQNILGLAEQQKLHMCGKLLREFNEVLETEFAGYRFIDGVLSPITNATEIQEIEISLSTTESFTRLKNCNIHLKDALNKFSDRNNPDYRNSIKEAISAVECIVKIIQGNQNATLGGALDKLKEKLKIHPSLILGFKNIYGYTSDEGGIRHSFKDETIPCDFEDAKFMLVSCSAFINYLVVKAGKVGIDIKN